MQSNSEVMLFDAPNAEDFANERKKVPKIQVKSEVDPKQEENAFYIYVKEFSDRHQLYLAYEKMAELARPYWDLLTAMEKNEYHERALKKSGPIKKRSAPLSCASSTINMAQEFEVQRIIKSYENSKFEKQLEKPKISVRTDLFDTPALNQRQSSNLGPKPLISTSSNENPSKHEKMRKDVLRILEYADAFKQLHTTVFYFINVKSDCDGKLSEFAISAFTLRDGIQKELCIKLKSDHKSCEKEDGDNSISAFLKLIRFLKPFHIIPLNYFTEGNLTDDRATFLRNKRLMRKLFEDAGEYEVAADLKIYPLNYLIYYMRLFTKKSKSNALKESPFNSLELAATIIKNDMDKLKNFVDACDQHEYMGESENCSLKKTRLCCFIFARNCCNRREYQIKEGVHYPKYFDRKIVF